MTYKTGAGAGNVNPKAVMIANEYGAPYEEVVMWFEKGYSANEIERAYQLGRDMHAEATDIFAMREAGMDWPSVRKALETIPDYVNDEEDEEEGESTRPTMRNVSRTAYGAKPRRPSDLKDIVE
jgi:hypothetical protein